MTIPLSMAFKPRSLKFSAMLLCLALMVGCGMPEVVRDSYEYVSSLFDKGDSSLRKRLVIVPFYSGINGLDARAKAMSKIVSQRLSAQGNLNVVKLEPLQEEMDKIGDSIRDPQERMLEAGRRLGINTILTGRITDLSVSYRFKGIYGFRDNTPFLGLETDLSLYDVTSGTLLAQVSKRPELPLSELESENIKLGKAPPVKRVDELAAKSVEPIEEWVADQVSLQAWSGVILAVENDKIKVPVGRDTGLPLDSALTIYARGEKIVSGGGRPIYLPGKMVGKIVLTKLGPRTSWAAPLPTEAKRQRQKR